MKHKRQLDELIEKLFESGIIKFGNFKLKSGIISPFYFDLRPIISYPNLFAELADAYITVMSDLKFDRIAGILFTGLPIATAISVRGNYPMVYCRDKAKEYGTQNLVEGIYEKGDRLLVIDDTITDGQSKLDSVVLYRENGFKAKDILVFLDRDQGGREILKKHGLNLLSVCNINQLLEILYTGEKIPTGQYKDTLQFFKKVH